MEPEKLESQNLQEESYGAVLKEVGMSVKNLVQSEVDLIKAEIKESSRNLGKHSAQVAIFGALLAISVFPFLAFLVIGLGKALNDRYWLSSLLVAVFCAAVGGAMTYRAYKKFKEQDFTLPHSREGLEREKETISEKIHDVKDATKRRVA